MTDSVKTSPHQAGMASDDPRRWLALCVIAVAQLMIVLDASIVNIALPRAQEDLGISTADRQWVITAYTLAFGGLLLLGGRIADYTGRKRTFIIGLGGFAVASALGGLAQNAAMLFAARGLQGAFAALLAPAALSLITVTFVDPKERARAFGVFGAISGGGAAIGLVLGGVLTEYASWRWCLGVNVPIALAAAVAATYVVHESRAQGDNTYDIPGAVLSTLGLLSLVYGFTEAAKSTDPDNPLAKVQGWTAGSTLTFLAIAVVLLTAFVVWERRTPNPLLPLRVVLDRNRGGAYLTFLFIGAGLFAMFLFLTYYFQVNLGYTPLKSGVAFLPFSGGIIIGAGVISQILPKVGPRPIMIPGLIMAVIGMFLLTTIGQETSYLTHVLPSQILLSLGLAAVFIPASSVALVGIGSHDAGVASAVLNSSQQIGGSLGTALLNTVFASAVTGYITGHAAVAATMQKAQEAIAAAQTPAEQQAAAGGLVKALQLPYIEGYHQAFYWAAGLLLAATITAFVLINAKKEDVPADAIGAGV